MNPNQVRVIIYFASISWASASASASTCTVPPAFWCDDPNISEKCSVLDKCSQYNSSVYKQKVKLTVIYEAFCPGCEEFISTTLYNITWLEWDGWQFIDLELIPYGNAHSVVLDDGSYVITCQHGPEECWMNKLHSCIMAVLEDSRLWLPVISCLHYASEKISAPEAADYCIRKPLVHNDHRRTIWACQNGSYGDELQKRAADKTDTLTPQQHTRVPWIAINDVSLRSMQYLCEYGHHDPVLYYALRHWFRGGRDPMMNKFGAKSKKAIERDIDEDKRKCILYGQCK